MAQIFFKCLVTVVNNLKHNQVVAGPAIREKVTGISQRRIKIIGIKN